MPIAYNQVINIVVVSLILMVIMLVYLFVTQNQLRKNMTVVKQLMNVLFCSNNELRHNGRCGPKENWVGKEHRGFYSQLIACLQNDVACDDPVHFGGQQQYFVTDVSQ